MRTDSRQVELLTNFQAVGRDEKPKDLMFVRLSNEDLPQELAHQERRIQVWIATVVSRFEASPTERGTKWPLAPNLLVMANVK